MSFIERFRTLIALPPSRALPFLYAHPSFFDPGRWPRLEAWAGSLPPEEAAGALGELRAIRRLYGSLAADLRAYEFGPGPIERLWRRLGAGEISRRHALRLAADEAVAGELSPLYVEMLAMRADRVASRGDWRSAVALLRLLLAALDALPDGKARAALQKIAVPAWMWVVHRAVADVPDGRLFHDAVARAEDLAARARGTGDQETYGQLMQDLGALHLDPYVAGRSSIDYAAQYRLWQRRLDDELGDRIATLRQDGLRLPPPESAFPAAAAYLRRAAAVTGGEGRARALKGLSEALTWSVVIGLEVDREEIVTSARAALALFDPATSPREVAALEQTLAYHGEATGDPRLEELAGTSPEDAARRLGPRLAIELFTNLAHGQRRRDPRTALETAVALRPLVRSQGDETLIQSHHQLELRLLAPALGTAPAAAPRRPLIELAAALRRRAEAEGWGEETLAAGLVGLAIWGPTVDREDEALELLHEARERAPVLGERFAAPLRQLAAFLHLGVAVNAVEADDADRAIEHYAATLGGFVDLALWTLAFDQLTNLTDLAGRAGDAGIKHLVVALGAHALALEQARGARATELLQRLCQAVLARMAAPGGGNEAALLFLWQVAKGHGFAAALGRPESYRWQDDDGGRALLARIAELRAEVAAAGTEESSPALGEELLLAAYAGPGTRRPGAGPAEVLANLEQRYDERLDRRLRAQGVDRAGLLRAPDRLRSALGRRSVLLSYFIGPSPDGRLGLYVLLLTRDRCRLTAGIVPDLPGGMAWVGNGEAAVAASLFAPLIADLRQRLIDGDPGPANVVPEVARTLAELKQSFFGGGIGPLLAELRAAGHDHLVIAPHGPLHVFPFHLLGDEDRPLAAEWIVTYLPGLALLDGGDEGDNRPRARRGVAALGLDFAADNPHRLPPLDGLAAEARAVAALFGGGALTGARATEAAFADALATKAMVHVATHGQHRVAAPAFQRLYLAPQDGDDGVLHAYEILGLDLRGLELLSLGACETALGRFDRGDNPRGLPASLFLAGAATIAGTLWEADSDAATIFFTTLYRRLRDGDAKLDAFARAQRATRRAFPAYRDWGAFTLSGRW
ncbi:MAG: CHAT domain-containing protein [Acidobacteria bacterium]|nr:MAG: CHAT domain-containing protein [Acidobacteriota bacterium]